MEGTWAVVGIQQELDQLHQRPPLELPPLCQPAIQKKLACSQVQCKHCMQAARPQILRSQCDGFYIHHMYLTRGNCNSAYMHSIACTVMPCRAYYL